MPRPAIRAALVLAPTLFVTACGGGATAEFEASGSVSGHAGGESTAPSPGGASSGSIGSAGPTSPPPPRPTTPAEPGARFYVLVDAPRSQVPRLDEGSLPPAHVRLRRAIDDLEGVAIAATNEPREAAVSRVRSDGRIGLGVQCSILRVDVGPQGTRAAVSMVVVRLENQAVLGALQGGALAPGAAGPEADAIAVEGAILSATRRLPELLETL